MSLWLVRHAQPLVAVGICYGALDVPAQPAATQAAAAELANVVPLGFHIVSSPLQRCEQLSQCLRGLRADLSYSVDARLAEMNFGAWEGQPWDAIARCELDAWTHAFASWRCGGAENVGEFMARVGAAWDAKLARPGGALWITHAGVIRAASLLSQGRREVVHAREWPRFAPGFGQWCVL